MNYPVSLISIEHNNSRVVRMEQYSKPGNLILRCRPEFDGFAGKDAERSWSAGILECWKKLELEFKPELVFSLLHHATTPLLQNTYG